MPTEKITLPATLQRSPKKAQRTYRKTLEHAYEEYDGDEERAHRVAYASLKHSFEKVGDRWAPKPKQAKAKKPKRGAKAQEKAKKAKKPKKKR